MYTQDSIAATSSASSEFSHHAGLPGSDMDVFAGGSYYHLSLAQQRTWALDQLAPGNPQHNVHAAFRLTGPLDTDMLEHCLAEVVQRHNILRTTFKVVNGQPVQVVANQPWTVTMALSDLSDLHEEAKEKSIQRLAKEEAQQPFDLARGPLIQSALLSLGEEEHVLLLTAHGIVMDEWSMRALLHELGAIYRAFAAGEPAPLPELSMQYTDFAGWQHEWLQGGEAQAQLAYWKQRLRGSLPVLELPTDRPRPPMQSHHGARQPLLLSSRLTTALETLSRQEGVTLFGTLLAAFETLLHRYTGHADIVLGVPIAGRARLDLAASVGPYANTLVLRTSLEGDPDFRDLLRRTQQAVSEAHTNQDVPFEKLVEELQPARDLSRTPLFGVTFALEDKAPPDLGVPGLTTSAINVDPGLAKYDLSLLMSHAEHGLAGWVEYNTDLFDSATITRMVGHFVTLLESIVANPGRSISELPMLTEVEQRQLLVGWNANSVDYPQDVRIHEMVERQAESTPEVVAASFNEDQLTYRQLNGKANRLAHHLRKLGIGPEVAVGVRMERSLSMLVALLGVLKAGGAYVPLDPAYPQDRLAFMLSDSQALVLLTQGGLSGRLPEHEATVIYLDEGWEDKIEADESNPDCIGTPGNLAYILYTSGSTGRPKGVSIEHRSGIALIEWAKETYTQEECSRVLASTSINFDLSVFELFVTLSRGGTVVLVENALHLPSLAPGEEVTLVNTVPSAIAELLRTGGVPPSVRVVNLAGEPLQRTLMQQLYRQVPNCRVFNLYGPTEDTTYSTFALMDEGDTGLPHIGRPIHNSQVYLLDQHLRPVPVGVLGELYIGGAGLARGYAGRPDLTAERFIPNPYAQKPGERLYKTGDLASYLPDGNIQFLGRLDHQVKLRGFRIELGEVEAVLRQHPTVQDTVLSVREDGAGDKRMVAYIVFTQDQSLTPTELRSYLRERLPEYMVPSAFVLLERLPLTPNGKVDRLALPVPESGSGEGNKEYVGPRGPVEEALVGIWASVLGVERMGVHDDFFELGGHSLLATQVISRVREVLSAELPLRRFFEAPTIAGLGESIEIALKGGSVAPAPPIRPIQHRQDIPLSFAQQRLWFLDQWQPASAAYNIPVVMRLNGSLHEEALNASINAVVARHEALRTTFTIVGDQPVQVIAPALDIPLPLVVLIDRPEEDREEAAQQLIKEETQRTFDLACGPLLRATLLRLAEEEHQLVLVMHHIVSDGWSMGVLAEELAELYAAFAAGQPSPLPDLPVQYADYAVWQREWLQGQALQIQLDYWKAQLADAPPLLELPTDRPRPLMLTYRGARQTYLLSRIIVDELKALSQREGVTLFMTMLAAYGTLLHRYTGQADILIGTPIANRTRPEIEGLIGFFVNTLVLRANFSGDPTFRELLERVRDMSLGAYAHQDVPFDRLVEELHPERNLAYDPLFQVAFVLQNAPMTALQLPNLNLANLEIDKVDVGAARFDLMFMVEEAGGDLLVEVEYNSDLFEAATISRMFGHYRSILEGILSKSDRPVAELPLLTDAEQRQAIVEWNSTRTDYPRDECIHDLFEGQAERTPDAIALIFREERLTYRELNARANQLAHHLGAMGVGQETMVGICMDRSIESVVAILGVLKAGGTYVPLDPVYPQERLRFMQQDAGISILLTHSALAGKLVAPSVRTVCLDTDWATISRHRTEATGTDRARTTAENLAYVMYTSGSTGQPKGIGVPHRGVVRLVKNTNFADLSADQVFLQFAPISFDASTLEIWGSLLNGARLVIFPSADVPLLEDLTSIIRRYGVTTLWLTAGLFHQMVESGNLRDLSQLRQLLAGGDVLSPPHVRRAIQELRGSSQGGCILINGYGPTENTTFTCCHPMTHPSEVGDPVSIGRPIANTQVYLLDKQMRPTPVGVAGELYIGGDGLARGYIGRPDLTAERFVPDPFAASEEAGARLYRTGDLARYLPDGKIEFLGRLDHQVKLRGFRIELGEIESVLSLHPGAQDAVVTVREQPDVAGGKRLVAYIVPKPAQAQPLTHIELRHYLKERLPDYMVPSAFVLVEKLPLTPNGKVDRRALPAPELGHVEGEASYVAPRNPVEEEVAEIWTSVLGVGLISVYDDFFEVGGHSLAATQVVSRVREAFHVELPLRRLFETPTIEGLATAIVEIQGAERDDTPVISRVSSTPEDEISLDLDQLSDEEVDALLRDMMTGR